MKKVCWLLILVLLPGCFAGCHQQPVEGAERSIENEDGTLSDWMKEEIKDAWEQKHGPGTGIYLWWSTEHPDDACTTMYLGTYNGYVMYSKDSGATAIMHKSIAGYLFEFSSLLRFKAYKDGEFYDLEDLLEQGLIDEEAIRIAHEHHVQITETIKEYRNQQDKSDG